MDGAMDGGDAGIEGWRGHGRATRGGSSLMRGAEASSNIGGEVPEFRPSRMRFSA